MDNSNSLPLGSAAVPAKERTTSSRIKSIFSGSVGNMFNPPRESCGSRGRAATGSKVKGRAALAVSRFLPSHCTILRDCLAHL